MECQKPKDFFLTCKTLIFITAVTSECLIINHLFFFSVTFLNFIHFSAVYQNKCLTLPSLLSLQNTLCLHRYRICIFCNAFSQKVRRWYRYIIISSVVWFWTTTRVAQIIIRALIDDFNTFGNIGITFQCRMLTGWWMAVLGCVFFIWCQSIRWTSVNCCGSVWVLRFIFASTNTTANW